MSAADSDGRAPVDPRTDQLTAAPHAVAEDAAPRVDVTERPGGVTRIDWRDDAAVRPGGVTRSADDEGPASESADETPAGGDER